VKLSSVETYSTTTSTSRSDEATQNLVKGGSKRQAATALKESLLGSNRSSFVGSVASQQQTRTSGTVKRDYEMEVKIRAGQAELPR
jgi:hypothetical protein